MMAALSDNTLTLNDMGPMSLITLSLSNDVRLDNTGVIFALNDISLAANTRLAIRRNQLMQPLCQTCSQQPRPWYALFSIGSLVLYLKLNLM